MLLRRLYPLAAALGAVACTPGIQQDPAPNVDIAVFDPTQSRIPQPNDLVFQALAAGQIPPGAQRDLLQIFHAAAVKPDGTCANGRPACGAFPSDQEVAIAIDFQRKGIDPKTGAYGPFAAPLDLTKVVPCDGTNGATCNLAVIELAGGAPGFAKIDAPVAADYVAAGDHGTLTLHRKLPAQPNGEGVYSRRWTAGASYVVAVRAGPSGLPTAGGTVQQSPTFYLLTLGVPLDQPANQTLLPGNADEKLAAGRQLEALRQSYLGAFGLVEKMAFPRSQLAVMSTFQIAAAPSGVRVQTDASAGAIPLPSDFLLDATTGRVQNLPSAFGALAPGLATLDGFSTTAMVLAQLSGPVNASTISGKTVFLYKFLTDSSGKITGVTRLHDVGEALSVDKDPAKARYISEPPQIVQTGAAQVIGLQPAAPILGAGVPPFAVPPLEESTEYGVVVTDGVLDLSSAGLTRSTLSKILLFTNPLADGAGRSLLGGVPDAQAAGLEKMRQAIGPLLAQVQADTGLDRTRVAIAYTFRTQSVTGKSNIGKTGPGVDVGALGLAAAPYQPASLGLPATYFAPGATLSKLTPVDAFTKYGIEQSGAPTAVPNSNILEVIEVSIPTVDLLDPKTGAFGGTPAPIAVTALIAVPKVPAGTCPAAVVGLPVGTKCAPLVVFHHGLGGTKAQMLTVADGLAAKGMVVAAIDSPKHGDRAFCASDPDCEGATPGSAGPAGSCVPNPALAGQGDSPPPGTCTGPGATGLRHAPQLCSPASLNCATNWGAYAVTRNGGKSSGQTYASSNYLVTANFFRTRDTIRQDVFDQSALVVALSPPAAGPPNPVQAELLGKGMFIDPTNIQWLGQSYGSILGAINVAANPRFGRAVLNVGGGTTVDIFSTPNSSFYPTLVGLLSKLSPPIVPGTSQYLQFLQVGKWVLDPADPINFATHVTANTLPNLLNTVTPGAPQTPKAVLGQLAHCDKTVPNQTNANIYLDMGLGPFYTGAAGGLATQGTLTRFFDSTAVASTKECVGVGGSDINATPHDFITSWGIDPTGAVSYDPIVNQLTQAAQAGAADFLSTGNLQPNVVTK